MGVRRGVDGKVYKNDGTYNAPSWTELTKVRDLTDDGNEFGAADASSKGSDIDAEVATTRPMKYSFDLIADREVDHVRELEEAYEARTVLDIAICDGDIDTNGTKVIRGPFQVMKFKRSQARNDIQKIECSISHTYHATQVLDEYEVGAS